ncbi:hypothetical protein BMS3Bbin04_01605 [bacterium BMS3Bbin04]|nr:hypothetical protein BMS3Bbin04_01605 [bacterium BMS3Bbin04]
MFINLRILIQVEPLVGRSVIRPCYVGIVIRIVSVGIRAEGIAALRTFERHCEHDGAIGLAIILKMHHERNRTTAPGIAIHHNFKIPNPNFVTHHEVQVVD